MGSLFQMDEKAGGSGEGKTEEPPVIILKKAPPIQREKKDVPMGLVLLVGVLIWVLVFGTIFSYAAFSPCSFVAVVIGERKTLETMADRLSMDFTDESQCRHFLRLTVVTPGFVAEEG